MAKVASNKPNLMLMLLIMLSSAFYVYITYTMFTYINDINKINECSKIMPVHKNVIWAFGVYKFVLASSILFFSVSVFLMHLVK